MFESVSVDTTIEELCTKKELSLFSDYFFTHMTEDVWKRRIGDYGNERCGILPAIKRIYEVMEENSQVIYDVYSKEEWEKEPDKEQVKLIHMPGDPDKPFVLVCPGGGYAREWVLVEGYPIAEQLNRMGYSAFVLIYRTGQKSLLPKPMEDTAAALKFLDANRDKFQIRMENYAMAGFSAGGHLAAVWGTKEKGYSAYDIHKPGALFLGYPSISTVQFLKDMERASDSERAAAVKYLERIGGENFTKEGLAEYSVEYLMDQDYPPCYLIHSKDDPVVNIEASYLMEEQLKRLNIPHTVRFMEHGGHSFGLGNGTELDGWLADAVSFWEAACGF